MIRTTISLSVPKTDAKKASVLARARGFQTLSDYLRFLLAQDDQALISEDEILERSKRAHKLHASGKLVKARSLASLLN